MVTKTYLITTYLPTYISDSCDSCDRSDSSDRSDRSESSDSSDSIDITDISDQTTFLPKKLTKKLLFFFFKKLFSPKKLSHQKSQMVAKLKTQNVKKKKSIPQNVTKLKNSKCDKTQNTQNVTKHKNSNYDIS